MMSNIAGCPSSSQTSENVAEMEGLLVSDHRMCKKMISDMLGLTKLIVYQIVMAEIQMWKVCYKLVLQIDSVPDKTHHCNR